MPDLNNIANIGDLFLSYNRINERDEKSAADIIAAIFAAKASKGNGGQEIRNNQPKTGLFDRLTVNERYVLLLDSKLQDRMSIRNGELYLDDISLQTSAVQVNTGKLADLKKTISIAYKAHVVENRAEISAKFDDTALDMNRNNLADALDLLDSSNHWYNSSDSFRKMYNAVKTLKSASDGLTINGYGNRGYMEDLTRARTAVENYLKHKNAFDNDRTNFKNSYEADRVAAARGLLRALKSKEESYAMVTKVREAEQKFERLAKYLEVEHKLASGELASLKSKYCSPERIRLHERAKAAVEQMENNAYQAEEKFKQQTNQALPAVYKSTFRAFILPDDKRNHNGRYLDDLADLNGNDENKKALAKARMQQRYRERLTSARKLDKAKLEIKNNQLSGDVADYAIRHLNAAVLGNGISDIKPMEMELGLSRKEQTEKELQTALKLGKAGYNMVKLLADDTAFLLPVDEFVLNKKINKFDMVNGSLELNNMTPQKKSSLGIFYNCVKSQTEELADMDKVELYEFKEDDFVGSIRKGVRNAQKAPEVKITRNNDMLAPIKDYFAVDPINDGEEPALPTEQDVKMLGANGNIVKNGVRPDSGFEFNGVKDADQLPENLLMQRIYRKNGNASEEDMRNLLKVTAKISDARARLDFNARNNNIYPEAADDMKILLFAESMKQDILNENAHPDKVHHYKMDEILKAEKPAEAFSAACKEAAFGENFNKLVKMVKEGETPKALRNVIDAMKNFATGNGAKVIFNDYRLEVKDRQVNLQNPGRVLG